MKPKLNRVLAGMCAVAMFITSIPAVLAEDLFARASTGFHYNVTQTSATGLDVETGIRKAQGGNRRMFSINYKPGGAAVPMVGYGAKLFGKSDINQVISYVEKTTGKTVFAAVNGDFFDTATGLPIGLVISEGRLVSSANGSPAVGFLKDGTVVSGKPNITVNAQFGSGKTHPIWAVNKMRTPYGIFLYTPDFSANTHQKTGIELVLERADGFMSSLQIGSSVTYVVKAINTNITAPTLIGENQMVLSLERKNYSNINLDSVKVGEAVQLSVTMGDAAWQDVNYAMGTGDALAEDGVLTAKAIKGEQPRTVLGTRPDGTMRIIVCDGRQSNSTGLSLKEAAEMLVSDGCKNVYNLDGGGSSVISVRYPGEPAAKVVSTPSDGAPRPSANFLLFTANGDPLGVQSEIAVYPHNPAVLVGGAVTLYGRGINDGFYPTGNTYHEGFAIAEGSGAISGDKYISSAPGGSRVSVITEGQRSIDAYIDVVAAPETMALVKKGTYAAINSISVAPNETIDLDVIATDGIRTLVTQDTQFTFVLSPNIGTITPEGVFTAAAVAGVNGTITAQFGEKAVSFNIAVGTAPTLLEGFETMPQYETSTVYTGTMASAVINSAREKTRVGTKSLDLSYTVAPLTVPESILYNAVAAVALKPGVTALTMWVNGSGEFFADFATKTGRSASPIIYSGTGWQHASVAVPAGATAFLGFSATGATAQAGALSVDQLICNYGVTAVDITPPTLTVAATAEGTAVFTVKDDYALPIKKDMLWLTVNGVKAEFEYNAAAGTVTCPLPQEGQSRITLQARDSFYNKTRLSLVTGQTVSTSGFGDLSGHWSADYAEYLNARGVFASDVAFRPENNVTNEMAATIISRYLGYTNVEKYAAVVLPYADADKIADWALPHVKALFANNVMIGSVNGNGVRAFMPKSDCSRAQIMTLLGRTIDRGYSYSAASFSDSADIPAWARDHIELLAGMGVVNGYGGTNEVKPSAPIKRGEFASMLYKLY